MEPIDKSRILNLKEVPESLIKFITCRLCKYISVNPRIERNCDSIFCKECIRNFILEKGKKCCPLNCESLIKTRLSKLEKGSLSNIYFSCKNREKGCIFHSSYLSIDQLISHEKECGFNQLICPKCRKIVVYNNFSKHEKTCVREYCINCEDYLNNNNECHIKTISKEMMELEKKVESSENIIKELRMENETLKGEIEKFVKNFNLKTEFYEKQIDRLVNTVGEIKDSFNETKIAFCELKVENQSFKIAFSKIETNYDTQRKIFEENVIKLSSLITDKESPPKIPQILSNIGWEKWGKTYNHNVNKTVFSVRTQSYLPTYFKARVRVKPTGVLGWFVVGVTRVHFSTEGKQFMWHNKEIKDCYVYNSNGYKSDSFRPTRYGDEYSVNDIISVIYDKNKSVFFEKNGIDMGVAFENVEGPFYLAASLYFNGDGAELLDVIELE